MLTLDLCHRHPTVLTRINLNKCDSSALEKKLTGSNSFADRFGHGTYITIQFDQLLLQIILLWLSQNWTWILRRQEKWGNLKILSSIGCTGIFRLTGCLPPTNIAARICNIGKAPLVNDFWEPGGIDVLFPTNRHMMHLIYNNNNLIFYNQTDTSQRNLNRTTELQWIIQGKRFFVTNRIICPAETVLTQWSGNKILAPVSSNPNQKLAYLARPEQYSPNGPWWVQMAPDGSQWVPVCINRSQCVIMGPNV